MIDCPSNSRKRIRCFLWRNLQFRAVEGLSPSQPIRTSELTNSLLIRWPRAQSRIKAIIARCSIPRRLELVGAIFVAMAALVFLGSSGEGQASLFSAVFSRYVEETSLALSSTRQSSGSQLAEMNSIFAGSGGDSAGTTPEMSQAPTIQESAIMAVSAPDPAYLDSITSHRSQVIEYTVQDGDLLSFIASDYGVSVDSVMWANNLKDADSISPGQHLRIPPITGIIHVATRGDTASSLAKKYTADEGRIIAFNRLPKDGALDVGDEIIIPDGVKKTISGGSGSSGTPSVPLLGTASVAKLVKAASQFAHLPDLGNFFKIPTFGFNWGNIHGRNGVDMANSCGTPIYAAADGKITVADESGWNGGFGKYIKIVHGNGTETLYAHASKLLVDVGQVVGKGDKIALMGTTGRSTGCHLHFEVHGAKNPLAK